MTTDTHLVASDRGAPSPPTVGGRARDWALARPGRTVGLAAAALLLAQALVRGWIGYRGYFFLDDFAFTGQAAHYPLTAVHDFLFRSYNSHVMPAAFAQVWVLTRLFPLNFPVVMTVNLLLQAGAGYTFYKLLVELFGRRPAILVPLSVFLFSPITLEATVWWAAALNQLPQQWAMAAALLFQVRYLKTGRTRTGLYGVLAVVGGLGFSEKTLLAVPLVAAVTVLWFTGGTAVHRVLTAARSHWRIWAGYLVVVLPYAAAYLVSVPSPARGASTVQDLLQLAGASAGHSLMPGLLGGPWTWHSIGYAGALAAPSTFNAYLAGIVVIGIVGASVAWNRRAALGWVLPVGYAVLDLALLAVSRATFIGPLIGDEYRYVTDVALVAALGGALAVLPIVGSYAAAEPQQLERRAWTEVALAHPQWREIADGIRPPRPASVVAALVLALLASSTYSTVGYDRYWSAIPAKAFVKTVTRELDAAPHGLVLYDKIVPDPVAWALLYPYNLESNFLRPLRHQPRYLQVGDSSPTLAVTDDSGHLRLPDIQGIRAMPGPVTNGCGWQLGAQPVTIKLAGTTYPWDWVIRMGYVASADTSAVVRAGETTMTVRLHKGVNEIFMRVVGRISTIGVSALSTPASVCTNDLVIGQVVPRPGTSP